MVKIGKIKTKIGKSSLRPKKPNILNEIPKTQILLKTQPSGNQDMISKAKIQYWKPTSPIHKGIVKRCELPEPITLQVKMSVWPKCKNWEKNSSMFCFSCRLLSS